MERSVSPAASDDWHVARLIPAFGIRGQDEQEKRATSSLLAVMYAVPEFAHSLLGPLGAPKGQLETFCEVQLTDALGKTHIPDGAIVARRGKRTWRCLVEVKTSQAQLEADQVNRYLDVARQSGFDAVLTISNQITAGVTETPVDVDRRKLRTIGLFHLSWWRILTEAIVQFRHRGIADPDQAWILGELIAYLDDERSGASGFRDMGDKWVTVRNGAGQGTLRASDAEVRDVVERWEQFIDYLSLGLGQDLGVDVKPVRSRKQTVASRLDAQAVQLADAGTLQASIRVPDAIGDLSVEADMRTRRVNASVRVDAPGDGRPLTRINWMLRQLKHASPDLIVEVSFVNTKTTTAALLAAAREQPQQLLSADPKRPPRSFRLSMSRPMGTKRGKGEKSFVRETRRQTVDFYRDLVQDLRAWRRSAPKLPDEDADDGESSNDKPESAAPPAATLSAMAADATTTASAEQP